LHDVAGTRKITPAPAEGEELLVGQSANNASDADDDVEPTPPSDVDAAPGTASNIEADVDASAPPAQLNPDEVHDADLVPGYQMSSDRCILSDAAMSSTVCDGGWQSVASESSELLLSKVSVDGVPFAVAPTPQGTGGAHAPLPLITSGVNGSVTLGDGLTQWGMGVPRGLTW